MPDNAEFLGDLIRDAIKRIEAVSEKVDDRFDTFSARNAADHMEMQRTFGGRLDVLEQKVASNTIEINSHKQNFTLLGFLLTGGAAGLVGLWKTLTDFFPHK